MDLLSVIQQKLVAVGPLLDIGLMLSFLTIFAILNVAIGHKQVIVSSKQILYSFIYLGYNNHMRPVLYRTITLRMPFYKNKNAQQVVQQPYTKTTYRTILYSWHAQRVQMSV